MIPALTPTVGAALLCAVSLGTPGAELPFEQLGGALLERTEAPSAPETPSSFLARLAPLHYEIRLGGLRLWIPRESINADASFGKGLDPRDARAWARDLLALQRAWIPRLGLDEPESQARLDALVLIDDWVDKFGNGELPPPDTEFEAAQALLERTFPDELTRRAPVVIVAPNRAHLVALFGATGLALPAERNRLWVNDVRTYAFSALFWDALVVVLEQGLDADAKSLIGERFEAERVRETIAHRASHLLAYRMVPAAPQWLDEGLALRDTILITGDDDSLCTGFSQRERIRAGVAVFEWIDANLSPYREGAASNWFASVLRPDDDGWFRIHDLERAAPALSVPPPFLGPNSGIPEAVMAGGEGLRRGFAEFYRAYAGTFVHWLSLQHAGDREVLDWLLEYLVKRGRTTDGFAEDPAAVGLRMITFKTLGTSDDPERDLEAAYDLWLAER